MSPTASLVPPRICGLTILRSLGRWIRYRYPNQVVTQTCAFAGRHSMVTMRRSRVSRGEFPSKPPSTLCHLIPSFAQLLNKSNTICICHLTMPKEVFSLLLTSGLLLGLPLLFQGTIHYESHQHPSTCISTMSLQSRFIGSLMCYGSLKILGTCLRKTQISWLRRTIDSRQLPQAVAEGASRHFRVTLKFFVLWDIARPWFYRFAVTTTLLTRLIGWLCWVIC